jgi:hypothetical protein
MNVSESTVYPHRSSEGKFLCLDCQSIRAGGASVMFIEVACVGTNVPGQRNRIGTSRLVHGMIGASARRRRNVKAALYCIDNNSARE